MKKHDDMLVRSLIVMTGYGRPQIERALASIDADQNAGVELDPKHDEVKAKVLDALAGVGSAGVLLPPAERAALSAFFDELKGWLHAVSTADDVELKDAHMDGARDVLDRMRTFVHQRQAEWDRKLAEYTRTLLLDPTADPDEVEAEADQLLFDAISYRREGRLEDAAALEQEAAPLLLKAKLTKLAADLDGAKAAGF